jgi:hypothetical protein
LLLGVTHIGKGEKTPSQLTPKRDFYWVMPSEARHLRRLFFLVGVLRRGESPPQFLVRFPEDSVYKCTEVFCENSVDMQEIRLYFFYF